MTKLTVAAVQICSTSDRGRNLDRVEELVREAHAASGCALAALPEVFTWRGPPAGEAAIAEPIPGPTVDRMGALARELGIHLLLGSLLESTPDEPRPYNTSVLLGPDGSLRARYRKIHLFDVDIQGHGPVRESATRAPGRDPVTADLDPLPGAPPPVRLGLSICYDLRFPELYRHLARAGAEILLIPASFTARTGRDHWLELLRARAIENLCHVIAPDQWGMGREGIETFGRSAIIDPWGTPLAICPDGEGFVTATLDLDRQRELRRTFPVLDHIDPSLLGR